MDRKRILLPLAIGVMFLVGGLFMPADIIRGHTEKKSIPHHEDDAFSERSQERHRMVVTQIESRGIHDPNVWRAMKRVPRHVFVPNNLQSQAYDDNPLPIGYGQTISQPYIVAFMTEALALDPNARILEIGTGSGYQAAVCAEIVREVFTIEIVEPLATMARERLKELGYTHVTVKAGDGFGGWPEQAPFDAIIGTAAARRIPTALLEQLNPGARMILPVENENGFQHLVVIDKDADGQYHQRKVLPVRFVPMTGEVKKKP